MRGVRSTRSDRDRHAPGAGARLASLPPDAGAPAEGNHLTRRATARAVCLGLAALLTGAPGLCAAGSLRFHGNGAHQIDRIKIRIDDPDPGSGGPPADVGGTDFTLEIWLRCLPGRNPAPSVACGSNVNWIYGNVVLDRDRYNQDRKFGLSLVGGRPIFGMSGDGTGDRTICAGTDLRDGAWHHVAVQRRRSDGHLWLHVDGMLEADADGPDGDVSYPDDGIPGDFCGGPCLESDPFLVLAAEKHDAGPEYPSFDGWLDELRLSTTLRYGANFTPPTASFTPDAATAALYHMDEGAGSSANDASGAPGGPSPGERRFGGLPAGPEWSTDTPFGGVSGVGPDPQSSGEPSPLLLRAAPNPFLERTRIVVSAGVSGAVDIFDVTGQQVIRLGGMEASGARSLVWNGRNGQGQRVPPGLYFARLSAPPTAGPNGPALRLVRR